MTTQDLPEFLKDLIQLPTKLKSIDAEISNRKKETETTLKEFKNSIKADIVKDLEEQSKILAQSHIDYFRNEIRFLTERFQKLQEYLFVSNSSDKKLLEEILYNSNSEKFYNLLNSVLPSINDNVSELFRRLAILEKNNTSQQVIKKN